MVAQNSLQVSRRLHGEDGSQHINFHLIQLPMLSNALLKNSSWTWNNYSRKIYIGFPQTDVIILHNCWTLKWIWSVITFTQSGTAFD